MIFINTILTYYTNHNHNFVFETLLLYVIINETI